ncbi:MAG TPA: 50S ribosomal protein L25/general stress protein Ctc [Casimicrobiaceae bacterium]|nr:50S ribosomal protein L25/general stress protein Ctc [Casimicrobiaceae bacterium]
MSIEFTAFPRTTEGRGESRRMRRAGKAPGIVYGGAAAPEPIELDHNALFHALRNEKFHASILTMKVNGASTKVLLRSVQMHPFKNEILHVDFQRVDENRKIHMKVPLHFVNAETSPAVKVSGAIVSHVLTELDIVCLPKDLPEFIEVDLSTLDVGNSVHVSALKLPAGVVVPTRGKLDPVIAAAVVPKAIVEEVVEAAPEGEEAAAAAAAAPGAAPAAPGTEAKPAAEAKGAEKKEAGKDEKKKESGKEDRKK